MAGAVTDLGASDFAAITDFGLGVVAAELGAALEGTLLPEAAGLMVLPAAPAAAFGPAGVTLEAGFAVELPAGLALAFDVADPAGEFGTEPDDFGAAGAAGLIVELVGGAGFEVCA